MISNTSTPTLTYNYAKRHGLLIDKIDDDFVYIIHTDLVKSNALIELRRYLQKPLQLQQISAELFQQRLAHDHQSDSAATKKMVEGMEEELDLDQLIEQLPKSQDLLETQDDAPIIRLLNALFTQAIKQKASDIHIETFEQRVVVRYRIDGILREVLTIQRVLAPLLISRIKVMAKLDIAEKRLPQDGRITVRLAGHTIDVRVSTLPSSHGERAVMRLLDKQSAHLDLQLLGMYQQTQECVEKLIAQPHGIILVTGPTGSGKTTSLYAMLTQLNQTTRNILTVEDPIEYDLPGIGQTQVNNKVDMTFAKGLRAILRQDPDVVMVGEIRDRETAEIAVQASLTGHLVLSTLHTNTALGAVARLHDMGVEPFLLSSSLIALMAQRLVRVLCDACKKPHDLSRSEKELLMLDELTAVNVFEPIGCEQCNHSGYRGRTGIYELISIDERLREMIHKNVSELELEHYARAFSQGIRQDGFRRVLQGETSLAEVLRVT